MEHLVLVGFLGFMEKMLTVGFDISEAFNGLFFAVLSMNGSFQEPFRCWYNVNTREQESNRTSEDLKEERSHLFRC